MKTRSGFTLIELLVVIAIIGLLSSVILVSLTQARAKGDSVNTLAALHNYETALKVYYLDVGYFPMDTTEGTKCLDGANCTYLNTATTQGSLRVTANLSGLSTINKNTVTVFGLSNKGLAYYCPPANVLATDKCSGIQVYYAVSNGTCGQGTPYMQDQNGTLCNEIIKP